MNSSLRAGSDPTHGVSPAVWLAYWILVVISVQSLSGIPLAACLILSFAFALRGPQNSLVKLLRRSRFLFLALFVLFAFFSPGTALFADFPSISPTLEGLELALIHLARLASVIALVAVLLCRLPPSRLVSGMVTLLRPMRGVGLSPERLAVRLSLVLELAQAPSEGGWRAWLHPAGEILLPSVRIERKPLGRDDLFWLLLLVPLCWWIF